MMVKTYAPVIIPTLNRYEHFRQCLESLEKCTGAENTDVYIGLDYPPAEKYVEGWKKIDEYLKEKEATNSFRMLIVIRHNTNCGIGCLHSNVNRLKAIIKEKYDCYIFSEDDNIFSPNFLEYINKGLKKYEKDNRVVAICGYSHPTDFLHKNNNHFAQDVNYSAWGYGTWFKKNEELLTKNLNKSFFKQAFYTPSQFFKIAKTGRAFSLAHASILDHIPATDYNYSMIMRLTGCYVIMPVRSMVRNMGWDATATHTRADNPILQKRSKLELSHPIDTAEHFEFIGNPTDYFEENNARMIKFGKLFDNKSLKLKCILNAKIILRFIRFWI